MQKYWIVTLLLILANGQFPLSRSLQDSTNDTDGTGNLTIVPPDKGFIAAMVVCIGVILIAFVIVVICFCCKK